MDNSPEHYPAFPFTVKILKPSKLISPATIFISALILFAACDTKVETVKKTEIMSLPSMTVKEGYSIFVDSGKVQLVLSAPVMMTYNNDDSPYSEFISGLYVVFFEGRSDSIGYAIAKYARYTDKKKLWELRDSVIVVNTSSNDRLETEQLFWDQDKNIIYTERFVKITGDDQTIMGTGFESDIRLTKRRIKNPSGPIYLRDE